MTQENLQKIHRLCLMGDRRSQNRLFTLHRGPLYALCLRFARDSDEAQDLLQEGFIQIFKDLHQFDPSEGTLLPWMRRVVINACLRFRRRNRLALVRLDPEQHAKSYTVTEAPTVMNTASALTKYLDLLPTGYRTVFNLHVLEGYSHPEIASLLDITVNTSKSQLSKAKAFLRRKIREGREKAEIYDLATAN